MSNHHESRSGVSSGAGDKPAPLTSAQKQARRIAELDSIAQAHGWPNWGKYETAVKNGVISIRQPRQRQARRQAEDTKGAIMNAADIISNVELLHLDRRETQFVRAELIEKIDAAIAAAVQAERERIKELEKMLEVVRGDALMYFEQKDVTRDVEINGWLLDVAQMIEADRLRNESAASRTSTSCPASNAPRMSSADMPC